MPDPWPTKTSFIGKILSPDTHWSVCVSFLPVLSQTLSPMQKYAASYLYVVDLVKEGSGLFVKPDYNAC